MINSIKRKMIIAGMAVFLVSLCALLGMHAWIGHTVKENIELAMRLYPGAAEEALILFLDDEANSARDRTHVAVWTLGRIGSNKALPVLYRYYKNDPEGKTCFGRHESVLCQYEIHKAITAIEEGSFFSYEESR